MSFIGQNGAIMGMGVGLLPLLLKTLIGGNTATPTVGGTSTAVASAPQVPAAAAPAAMNAAQPQAAATPTTTPTAAMLSQAQKLFPGATPDQLPAYISANPDMFRAGGNPYQETGGIADALGKIDLGKVGDALGKQAGPAAAAGPGGGVYMPPPPHPLPGPGGGGGPMVSPISPAQMMTTMPMPGGGGSYPLGPASTNPFIIAMMKQRLGMA